MRAKGWTHEGDDKIINMLFDLPNNRLSPNDPKTFRGTTCLSANGNGVESRRDLFKKAVA